jgi:hypothetical protein
MEHAIMERTAGEDEAVRFDNVFAHRLPTGAWVVSISAEGGPCAIGRGAPDEAFDVVLDAAIIALRRQSRSVAA